MKHRFWEVLGRLLPHQPVWQAITATFLLAVVTGSVLWGLGIFTPGTDPYSCTAPPRLQREVHTAQSAYLLGEEIEIQVWFKNVSIEIQVWFKNVSSDDLNIMDFPPKVEIVLPIYRQTLRIFTGREAMKSLSPGAIATYTLTWDQRDSNEQQVAPGYYYVDVAGTYIWSEGETYPGLMNSYPEYELLIQ